MKYVCFQVDVLCGSMSLNTHTPVAIFSFLNLISFFSSFTLSYLEPANANVSTISAILPVDPPAGWKILRVNQGRMKI